LQRNFNLKGGSYMRKKSIAILALASVVLFSCGGPEKSPTLALQKTSYQKTQNEKPEETENKKPGTCNDKASSDINLGLQLVASGDLKNASKQFKQAIKDDNSCALGYVDLASAYINRKDYDKAIDVAKEGLKNAGENKDLEYVLACAYSRDKKLDYSLDALKKALKDGFNDPNKLAHDPDLQNLRLGKKKDFCELLNKYKITIKYCLV